MGHSAGRFGDVGSDRAHFHQIAVGFIDAQFALQDQGSISRVMAVQHDPFIGLEFQQDIDDLGFRIDFANMVPGMVDAIEYVPFDIALIERGGRHDCLPCCTFDRCLPDPGLPGAVCEQVGPW